jgi:hypothetical protein
VFDTQISEKSSDPEQILLQCSNRSLSTTIAFRFVLLNGTADQKVPTKDDLAFFLGWSPTFWGLGTAIRLRDKLHLF